MYGRSRAMASGMPAARWGTAASPLTRLEPRCDVHRDASIRSLGVWGTVGSLGIPGDLLADENKRRYAFHDTSPSPIVRTACHALAIDEHRRTFTPT